MLRLNNSVNERTISPGFDYSRSRHAAITSVADARAGKPLLCELPEDGALARPRWAGEYESIIHHQFLHDNPS